MAKVIAYRRLQLYFGLKSKGWNRYLWLNVQALALNLLKPSQTLVHTKYFTSRISAPADKVKRQNTYIEALDTLTDFAIFYGKYQMNTATCRQCGFIQSVPQEKMTDVNIAVELMQDVFQDSFDTAVFISADSDLVGPVAAVERLFPNKRVVVGCPPDRFSTNLTRTANAYFTIDRGPIARSLFPDRVTSRSGFVLQRPEPWK